MIFFNNQENDEIIGSFLIAIGLASNFLAVSINTIVSIPALTVLSIAVFIISILNKPSFSAKRARYIVSFSILPILSTIIIKSEYCTLFLEYYIQATLLAMGIRYKFSLDRVIKYILLIYGVFFWGMIINDSSKMTSGDLMGLSYAVLPALLASIYIVYYKQPKEHKKRYLVFATIIFLSYFFITIQYFTRGGYLAIAIFCLLLYIRKNSKKKTSVVIIFGLLILMIADFKNVVYGIKGVLDNVGIAFPVIDEIAIEIERNTLLNGREMFIQGSLAMIRESPIWGNGTAAFARYYNSNYDHNFILQCLNEGGVIFLIWNLIPLLFFVVLFFNSKEIYEKDFVDIGIFLFCISVVRLFFSYSLWREQGYWMLLYLFCFRNVWKKS